MYTPHEYTSFTKITITVFPPRNYYYYVFAQNIKQECQQMDELYEVYINIAKRIFKVSHAEVRLQQAFTLHRDRYSNFEKYELENKVSPVFIVFDAQKDQCFRGPPNIRFYAETRLEIEGVMLGTFCILDWEPRDGSMEGKLFGEKEIAMLQDLAGIVSNLIHTRQDERLSNIYESLVMNADILKLYRIPLQNVEECKKELMWKYELLKDATQSLSSSPHHNLADPASHRNPSLKVLLDAVREKVQIFSRQVNRFLSISWSINSLLVAMMQLKTCMNSRQRLPPVFPLSADFLDQISQYQTISCCSSPFSLRDQKSTAQLIKIRFSCSCHCSGFSEGISSKQGQDDSRNMFYSLPSCFLQVILLLVMDFLTFYFPTTTISIEVKTLCRSKMTDKAFQQQTSTVLLQFHSIFNDHEEGLPQLKWFLDQLTVFHHLPACSYNILPRESEDDGLKVILSIPGTIWFELEPNQKKEI